MRFKDLTQEVLAIAKRDSVSQEETARIDSILANVDGQLSTQEQRTLASFFWGTASAPIWISLLRHHILNCPSAVLTDRGYQVPTWFAEPYVRSQIKNGEQAALNLLFDIRTNNGRFYEVVAEAAVIVTPDNAKALLPLLVDYANNRYSYSKRKLAPTLSRFATIGLISEALSLAAEIVGFARDPMAEQKLARKRTDPKDWTTSLEPQPKLDNWEYQEVLEKGIRPLAVAAPLQTARLLISAAGEMLRLKSTTDEERWSDTSEIWAPRIDQPERYDIDPKATLIRTLTYSCEQAYEQAGNDLATIRELDEALREAKWLVFTRLRQHLYSRNPDKSKEWIRQEILAYPNYERWEYHFEFQRMVRVGCEHFGNELLSRDRLTSIFDRILSGPDKDQFKEFMGEGYTEDRFLARQRHFQLFQLRPFEAVLFGKYKDTYDSLRQQEKAPSDEDYSPYPVGESKTGGSRSPKPVDELLRLNDEELLAFLNDWDNAHRDPEQWWVDIDFRGVGLALKQAIERDPERFLAWGDRWHSIERPIYFSYALQVGTNWVKEKNLSKLRGWLDLCDWIMQQTYVPNRSEEQSDESSLNPDWDSARRAVVDFIEACLTKEASVPIEWRNRLFDLIKSTSLGPDRYLDGDKAIVTPRDYLTDAINTTRGRALQNLIQFGFWIHQQRGERVEVPEVFGVLEARLNAQPPLANAEYALLGTEFNRLFILSETSAQKYSSALFPLDKPDIWLISFAHYLNWDRAFKPLFEVLRPHFEFALESIRVWDEKEERRSDPIAHLGEHLFAHYVWANDFLESEAGLLKRFYQKTSSKQWATLFDHVGRSLKNSPADLDVALKDRCKAFFEFRLAAHDALELQEFMFWLDAPCLESEWRLRAFLRTLEITKGRSRHIPSFIESLTKLLPEQQQLVVQCFASLTQAALTEEYFYIQSEKAMPILETGLRSLDGATREAAMAAQDNLLRAGHSEFLNVGQSA